MQAKLGQLQGCGTAHSDVQTVASTIIARLGPENIIRHKKSICVQSANLLPSFIRILEDGYSEYAAFNVEYLKLN